jgi:hypothetical protein
VHYEGGISEHLAGDFEWMEPRSEYNGLEEMEDERKLGMGERMLIFQFTLGYKQALKQLRNGKCKLAFVCLWRRADE